MKKKLYKIIRGKHHSGGKTYNVGDTLELSPRAARALVNKIEPAQAEAELFPEKEERDAPLTREEMIAFLTNAEIEVDLEWDDEEIKNAFDFANLPED